MRNKIKIGKPYIKEGKSNIFSESVRLCADVTMKNPNTNEIETKECYFEFETKYKKYLCLERSDAFVMGLLSSAMELDMDIEFENPISEQLYYQLTTYYIPMISKYNANYPMHNIKLIGPYDSKLIENEGAVATGCSGGVDSFYTIARHSKGQVPEHNELTHIVYSSSGTSDSNKERISQNYINTLVKIKKIAEECNLATIACYNNLNEFYVFPYKAFNMFYTTIFGSIVFALQKLVSIYYTNSGDPISEFNLDVSKGHGYSSATFDVFTLSCMNTENLQFYSTGMEYDRIEKEQYIADYEPAQKLLNVCNVQSFYEDSDHKQQNCSFCEKCLRTMVQFYSLKKLEKFEKVFNVEEFMKHKTKRIGKVIGMSKPAYVNQIKKSCKQNNVKIPIGSYLYAYFWYRPIKILIEKFKNSLLARKIYYKFNLDYKLNGFRGPAYEAYKDKIK